MSTRGGGQTIFVSRLRSPDPHVAADVVLGVDIGTTSTKVLALCTDGRTVVRAPSRAYPLLEHPGGHVVQDPGVVVQAVIDGIREATALVSGQGQRVRGVALSAAMHSLVGLDRDGVPTTPLLTWADSRAGRAAERLRAEHPGLHGRTGTPLHPMSPFVKLVHLREHDPEVFTRTTRWVGVKELVVHRLTGVWATDRSIASGTGLMNLFTEHYDPEALEIAGVTVGQLAAIGSALDVLPGLTGPAAGQTGLARDTPVILGAGDGPLANLGAGAVAPGVAACSIGTSGALRLLVDRPGVDPAGHLFCYALTPGRWAVGGAVNNGGVVLEWAADALAPELTHDRERTLLELAAAVAPGSDGLLMLPNLLGERTPGPGGVTSGAYVGLRRHHGRGHLVRAALEGVCQQLALVLDAIRAAGHDVHEVHATGGFTAGALWPQILADTLALPVVVPAEGEGSARGAALVGLQALGFPQVKADDAARTLAPDPAAGRVYARIRPVIRDLAAALGPVDATLHPPPPPA